MSRKISIKETGIKKIGRNNCKAEGTYSKKDVMEMFGFSRVHLDRILKKHDIKVPRNSHYICEFTDEIIEQIKEARTKDIINSNKTSKGNYRRSGYKASNFNGSDTQV